MERPINNADRACSVASGILAAELNSELTIILSGITDAVRRLEPGHPARQRLAEAQRAIQRSARACQRLLDFRARHGLHSSRSALESVLGI